MSYPKIHDDILTFVPHFTNKLWLKNINKYLNLIEWLTKDKKDPRKRKRKGLKG